MESENGGRLTEIALPAELPLREILPAVQRMVLPADDAGTAPDPVRLSLAPIGGAPFSLDATPGHGRRGRTATCWRCSRCPPAHRLHAIVEDIADAAVIFSASRQRPWGIDTIRRAAAIAVIGLILLATGSGGGPPRRDRRARSDCSS